MNAYRNTSRFILTTSNVHVSPWECTYAKEDKVKCLPGRKPKGDLAYFEIMCLCVLQAGLSWGMIRRNWKGYRKAFFGFSTNVLSGLSVEELIKRKGILRNRVKIEAILYNAKEFQKICEEFGSFEKFIQPASQHPHIEQLLSTRFKRFGPLTTRYFLHSIGYKKGY